MEMEKLDLVMIGLNKHGEVAVSGFRCNGDNILKWILGDWDSFPMDWLAVKKKHQDYINRRYER